MAHVAEHLDNTPAVARRSYVDPRVLAAWERAETIDDALAGLPDDSLDLVDEKPRATVDQAVLD